MRLLPVRMAVLNFLYGFGEADIEEIMQGLQEKYGGERQFTNSQFLNHVMSLEANGLIVMKNYALDEKGELSLRYAINKDGRSTVEKYVPRSLRMKRYGEAGRTA